MVSLPTCQKTDRTGIEMELLHNACIHHFLRRNCACFCLAMQGGSERFLVSTFYTGISRTMPLSLDRITLARDGLLFEPSSNVPIVRAEFIEQGVEAGVVARLQ